MDTHQPPNVLHKLTRGALPIAGLYLLIGGLWILFSDEVAARVALSEEMLTTISLYKGWGYVVVTALLLYWLIQRHTKVLHAGEEQMKRVIDAMPAFIAYVGADRHYRFTNKTYKEWFNDQAEGKHMEEVIGKAAYKTVSKYIDRVLTGETTSYEAEVPYQDKELFIAATYIPDIAADGRVPGFFVMAQDKTAQKQAEEEQRLWADAFEGCAHGIAIHDPVTHRILVCNPAFAGMHKCRVEDIVGSAILSLYASADHEHMRRNIEKADQIGHARYEAHMVRKDGSTFPVQMDLVSVLGEDGELLYRVATAQDISEQKLIDEKLKESETKYRTLVEHLPAITYTSEPDQYVGVSYISPQIESLGFNSSAWLADPEFWLEQIHPDDQERVRSELQQFQAGKESFEAEYRLLLPSGEIRWFHDESVRVRDQDGKPTLKQGFMLDITERKQAEIALMESNTLFRTLFEASPDAILLIDPHGNWPILDCNTAACQMNGYTHSELVGQPIDILNSKPLPSGDLNEYLAKIRQAGVLRYEAFHRRKNGADFAIEVSTSLISPGGRDVLLGIDRDITERKQAEEKIRKSEERYRYLFENNPHPMWIYDRKTLAFLDVNESAIAKYGYSRQEFLGMSIVDIRPPEEVEKLMNNLAQPRQPLERSTGWRHRLKDGTIIYVEITSHTIETDGHESALVIAQDITERKRTEEALRISEERFRFALASSPIIVANLDRELRYTWVYNPLAGFKPEDVVGKTIGLSTDPETQASILKLLEELLTNGTSAQWETAVRGTDGEQRFFQSHAEPLRDSQGEITGVTLLSMDITERKQAEQALRESEQKFSVIYYKAPFAAALSRLPDGVIVDVNEAFERVFGYTQQEVIGKTSVELGINPNPEERARVAAELQERGFVREIELRLRTKSRVTRVFLMNIDLVDIDGQQYIFQTAQDVTERRQAEEALQRAHDELELKVQERTAALSQANSLLQALMDTIPDHIYFKDTQCRFIRNSKSQANALGLSDPAQTIGKTDFDFFPHAATAYAEEQEVMKSGKPLVDFEEWVVWPNGRETWVSTTKVPLQNSEGQTIGIFGISRDITERKRTEQAIRQLNADLEKQAEQLQSANQELEAFSYSVSHDLRAPLRAIDGYTRILVEDYEANLDAEGKRVCGVISAEARRMGQLIDDLLAFSRLVRKQMFSSKIDMKALAISVFEELTKETDRERIDFQIAKLPSMKGDLALMHQVWVNLLSNALKFTAKKERAIIEVGSKPSTDELIYYVRDTGAGFDAEYADKLFGVFQRLHSESEFEGTGVGLAIVQRIIRRHGGRVWAEGEVEKGATFYFALPRKENQHD